MATTARGRPLSEAERRAVASRLVVEIEGQTESPFTIPSGDARFVRHRVPIPEAIAGIDPEFLEPRVTGAVAPRGVIVEPRADRFVVRNGMMHWVVVVRVRPGTPPISGRLRYDLNLVERRGLGNSVLRHRVRSRVRVVRASFTASDLARDYMGYRTYRDRSLVVAASLRRAGLRLGIDPEEPIPPTPRLAAEGVDRLRRFIRLRHRLRVAEHHLDEGRRSEDREVRELAETYWSHRDAEAGLDPDLGIRGRTAASGSRPDEARSASDILEPIATYDADPAAPVPPSTPPIPSAPRTSPSSESEPPRADARPAEGGSQRGPDGPPEPEGQVETPRTKAEPKTIPAHARALTLDDPNIAFGGSVRFAWAEARVRESATTAVLFYSAQAALTSRFGLEATVPTQFVSLHDLDADSVYTNGNPLIALKARFHGPRWWGRRAVFTVRTRLGIPFSPPSELSPSDFTAESFTREVHFTDPWAFLADYWDIGLGASFGWSVDRLMLSAQLHVDYLPPLDEDDRDLFALSPGLALGWRLARWLGAWAEGRATSLWSSSGRTELVAYAGARGRLWDVFEPAVFVGIPIGSITETSTPQVGAELRLAFDQRAPQRPGR